MKRPRLRDTRDHISEEAVENGSRLVPPGTIFVVIRGMILAKDLPVAMAEVPMAFNQDMKAVLPGDGIDGEYLLYALASCKRALAREISTSAHGTRRMETASLESLLVPVPPLPEQRSIAAVLSKVQAAVEVQDKIVATLKELKSATMAKLFREGLRGEPLKQTEIGEIPESWEIRRLGDIARIGNGSTPKRTNPDYWEGGTIPWLTSTKVHDITIRRPSELVTELAARECHLPVVPRGSIVVAITGQGKTLGNAALVTFDTRINQHLAFVQVNDPSVAPEFVLSYLLYRYEDLRRAASAGGSTKAALTCAYLETYAIPTPTFDEQRQIASTLLMMREKQDAALERCNLLRLLFSSMLHLLMTGQVRVKGRWAGRTVDDTMP